MSLPRRYYSDFKRVALRSPNFPATFARLFRYCCSLPREYVLRIVLPPRIVRIEQITQVFWTAPGNGTPRRCSSGRVRQGIIIICIRVLCSRPLPLHVPVTTTCTAVLLLNSRAYYIIILEELLRISFRDEILRWTVASVVSFSKTSTDCYRARPGVSYILRDTLQDKRAVEILLPRTFMEILIIE